MASNEINQVVVNGRTYNISGEPSADTNENFATIETDTQAVSKAYAIGDHLVANNIYYKVIAAIAQGSALVFEGTGQNVTKAAVGDEISQLKSALVGDTIGSLVTVNASNYTSRSNLYIIPYDCYITIHSLPSISQRIQMNDETGNAIEVVRGDGTYGGNVSLFMRKGMKVYFAADTFTGPTVTIREIS